MEEAPAGRQTVRMPPPPQGAAEKEVAKSQGDSQSSHPPATEAAMKGGGGKVPPMGRQRPSPCTHEEGLQQERAGHLLLGSKSREAREASGHAGLATTLQEGSRESAEARNPRERASVGGSGKTQSETPPRCQPSPKARASHLRSDERNCSDEQFA